MISTRLTASRSRALSFASPRPPSVDPCLRFGVAIDGGAFRQLVMQGGWREDFVFDGPQLRYAILTKLNFIALGSQGN
jgi:hypothetical protein